MTDHYEEFRPEEIDERLEQLLQLDDVAFPSSNLEYDVRMAKYLELLFLESGSADKASIESVRHKLFQQLPKHNSQSEYGKITSLTTNNARYLKRDQSTMQKNSYHRRKWRMEVLVAVCLLGIVSAGLLVFLNIYQHNHQLASPTITPTAVPANPKATHQATHLKQATPTTAPPARTCSDNVATQQASTGTYVRSQVRIYKLDNQSGQIDWMFPASNDGKGIFGENPLVVGNIVYVSTYSGGLYALDAEKGTVLWSQQYPVYEYSPKQYGSDMQGNNPGSYSYVKSLQVDCSLLSFIGSDENLHVLDATTGADVWHTNFPKMNSAPVHSLIVGQGTLYYSSSLDAKVHAYNIVNGHEIWSQALIANKMFTHIENNMLYNATQVLNTGDGHVMLDMAQVQNGLQIQRIDGSIAYFFSNLDPTHPFPIGAYDINAQSILWRNTAGGLILESQGRVFTQEYGSNAFVVLDGRSGQVLWKKNLSWWKPDNLFAQALDTGNVLYLKDTNVLLGTSLDGQILWNYSYPMIDRSAMAWFPVISDGGQWMYKCARDVSGLHIMALNPQVGQAVWQQVVPVLPMSNSASDQHYPGLTIPSPFGSDGFGIVTIV